jgi:hypothetical protein
MCDFSCGVFPVATTIAPANSADTYANFESLNKSKALGNELSRLMEACRVQAFLMNQVEARR